MVTLPKEFVAIKYPGYFWNLKDNKLYSLKVSGVLRPLAGPYKPNPFNHQFEPAYHISVNGSKRRIGISYLTKLKATHSIIPMEKS